MTKQYEEKVREYSEQFKREGLDSARKAAAEYWGINK